MIVIPGHLQKIPTVTRLGGYAPVILKIYNLLENLIMDKKA